MSDESGDMAESKHDQHDQHDQHDHAGGQSCCGPARVDDDGPEFTDPAGEHLSAALRTSFRLLGAAMVLGALAFLAVGFQFIQPGEVAIRTVFGKVVGVTPEGLAYNWPAPIGRIEKIKIKEQTVDVEDFWMNETRADKEENDLRKRTAPPGGLRPGWDGALLTGDRNLLHMRLKCNYTITRKYDLPWNAPELASHPVIALMRHSPNPSETVEAALKRAQAENADLVAMRFLEKADSARTLADVVKSSKFASSVNAALYYRLNVLDGERIVHSVVCAAAIRAAATRTADGLQRTQRGAFERDVMDMAQEKLDTIRSGILVRSVKVTDSTWPLATLPDYDAAQSAVQQAETLKSQARSLAVTLLNSTAGIEAARLLVGDVGATGPADPNTNLIGQYNDAVSQGDEQAAAGLLDRIDNVLVSDVTTGAARAFLSNAAAYRTDTIQAVKKRVTDFLQRLPAYEKNPSFAMNRWWDEAREEILSNPTAEKHYLTESDQKIILKINRDSDIIRQTRRAWTQWLSGQKEKNPPTMDIGK